MRLPPPGAYRLSPDVPSILADSGQIEQAVMNLVVNARDAMASGGNLRVSTRAVVLTPEDTAVRPDARPGNYVAIAVSDTGSGIAPELLVQIFEPFFTTKAAGKGTGLGLATVYGIAKQSEGFIDVVSTPGIGSTFTLYLPAAPPGAAGPARAPTAASILGDELILVVEDQDEVRALARRILTMHGYRVIEARNGVDALGILYGIDLGVDLVLTDAIMPQMSGPELLRVLRLKQPALPVVIVSGYTDHEPYADGGAGLIVPFLAKPFSAEDLLLIVRKALDDAAI
ncbi:MAG: ATP-binding protein [Gemmatimonadales bacterium]